MRWEHQKMARKQYRIVELILREILTNAANLCNIQNGRHHVGFEVVQVGQQLGAPGVLSQPVD